MVQYVLRRVLLMVPSLVGVSIVVFGLIQLSPGSVEDMKFAATAQGEGQAGADMEASIEKFRRKYLLDQPIWKQYLHYVGPFNLGEDGHSWFGGNGEDKWNGLLVLDLGTEFLRPSYKVKDELIQRLKITVPLALIAILISYLVAVPTGIYSAVRQGSILERTTTWVFFALYAVPTFWGGILLQMLCGKTGLDLLPILGLHDKDADQLGSWEYALDLIKHLTLPVLAYSYVTLAYLSRQMRVGVMDSMTQDYVRTARAKGLAEKVVVLKHITRNSLIPILTVLASVLPILVGGSIIVEFIFDIPGMGSYAYQGLVLRETNIILATVLVSALMTMVGFLLSDVLYAVVDPRIRYE